MELRAYQIDAVNQLWDSLASEQRVLCVMPTASGKTVIFKELIRRAAVKTVVVLKGSTLVSQTAKRLDDLPVPVSVYAASEGRKERWGQCIITSIDSLDDVMFEDIRFIICDEAHNINDGRYASFLSRHPSAKLLGFTATPWRSNTVIYGEGEMFSRIHFTRSVKQMIDEGWIVRPISKQSPESFRTEGLRVVGGDYVLKDLVKLVDDTEKVRAQIADALPRLVDRRKVVWICTSIEHAEEVCSVVSETEPALVLHSKLTNAEYVKELFERPNGPRHMVSVMMVKEGYDYPAIDGIVLMRPTRSITLMVQIIGRGLRLSEGKKNCLVLDYGKVIENCGPITAPYVRTARSGVGKGIGEITLRVCPKCLSYIEATPCRDCGFESENDRDLKKNLERKASEHDVMGSKHEPEFLIVSSVDISQYTSKAGNGCIRIDYKCAGRMWPISMFGTFHPRSWNPVKAQIERMTPWKFDSWEECFKAANMLVIERQPNRIRVERVGEYERITGWEYREPDRAEDSNGAREVVSGT